MKKITKLEFDFIRDMVTSDHSSDGCGIVMWVSAGYCSMNPKQWRAIVTSLVSKGIIGYEEADPGYKWTWDYENDIWDEKAQHHNDRRGVMPGHVNMRCEHQNQSDLSWEEIEEIEIDRDENGRAIFNGFDDNFRRACLRWTGYEVNGLEVCG